MSTPIIVRKMPETEWLKIGDELYGAEKTKWEFACPNCKLVMSFEKYEPKKAKLKDWQPYAECVGRYLKDEGCDWAAYGLFSGPRELVNDDGSHRAHVFYFAKEVVA